MLPTVRPLRADEALAYREMRLRALAGAPTAFGTTLAEALQRPAEWWVERAAAYAEGDVSVLFVAEGPDGLCGMAGGLQTSDHEADVFSMWVDPNARGSGVAEELLRAVEAWSVAQGALTLHLWVTEGNQPAIRLYERYGFVFTGASQPHPSQPLRELQMRRGRNDAGGSPAG
jgi:ribosomal protein S18 acetylase RimI-like enzyme